jgi:hypothetical protein
VEKVVLVTSLLACLFLVSRGMPVRSWPVVIAATLALVLLVVLAEQNGYWPSSWKLR